MPEQGGLLQGRRLVIQQGDTITRYSASTPHGGEKLSANQSSKCTKDDVYVVLDLEEQGDSRLSSY